MTSKFAPAALALGLLNACSNQTENQTVAESRQETFSDLKTRDWKAWRAEREAEVYEGSVKQNLFAHKVQVLDKAGAPINGVTISFVPNGVTEDLILNCGSTITDCDGIARVVLGAGEKVDLAELPSNIELVAYVHYGGYLPASVKVDANWFKLERPRQIDRADELNAIADEHISSTTLLVLEEAGTLTGTVIDAKTGEPIHNADVDVVYDRTGAPDSVWDDGYYDTMSNFGNTDEKGLIRAWHDFGKDLEPAIRGIPQNVSSVIVRIEARNYAPTSVRLDASALKEQIKFTLERGSEAHLSLTTPQGLPYNGKVGVVQILDEEDFDILDFARGAWPLNQVVVCALRNIVGERMEERAKTYDVVEGNLQLKNVNPDSFGLYVIGMDDDYIYDAMIRFEHEKKDAGPEALKFSLALNKVIPYQSEKSR